MGIITLISLITALALSGQAATYLHDTITNNINGYAENQDSIDAIDLLQTKYQCCGVNLWMDWANVALGPSSGISKDINNRKDN